MGTKGNNSKSWVLWEELEHLRVSPESGAVSIYKRQDPHLTQATEKRPYQIHIPVPDTKGGIRKSLKTPDRETAMGCNCRTLSRSFCGCVPFLHP